MHVQSCCYVNLNLLLFVFLVLVAVFVAQVPCLWAKQHGTLKVPKELTDLYTILKFAVDRANNERNTPTENVQNLQRKIWPSGLPFR